MYYHEQRGHGGGGEGERVNHKQDLLSFNLCILKTHNNKLYIFLKHIENFEGRGRDAC